MNSERPGARVRTIGLLSAAALVVANMIGTGVFTTSGFLLADLGSPAVVLLAWFVGGILAALGALCYGALARRLPESGGEYHFLSQTLHPALGYLAGWISLLVGFSAPVAAAAFAFGEYSKAWLGGLSPQITGTFLIMIFAALHAADVRRGVFVQNWAVLVKVALILVFAGFAAARMDVPDQEAASTASISAFGLSLVWISFSYSGWNAAVYIGGEVRDPERNLPRALFLGTAVVMMLYLMLNAVLVYAAPVQALAGNLEVARIAAESIGGSILGNAVSIVISLTLISSVSAMVMAGPRVYARMAEDGYLPRFLAAQEGPPRPAIGFQAALALILLWSASYEALLTYIGFTLSLSTAATVTGLIVLRWREGPQLRVPGWPIVPVVFVGSVLTMAGASIYRKPLECAVGFLTLLVGFGVWLRHRHNSKNRPTAA